MEQERYNTMLTQLMAGAIKPSSVVGRGYKYPKSVASSWIRTQIHNQENPNSKISDCYVTTSGKPFPTESKAMASEGYKLLVAGKFKLISDRFYVKDYGVMPAPGGDGGYVVYTINEVHKNSAH